MSPEELAKIARVLDTEALHFVDYLEDTLIPDLRESGNDATADDFEKCVMLMCRLLGRINN